MAGLVMLDCLSAYAGPALNRRDMMRSLKIFIGVMVLVILATPVFAKVVVKYDEFKHSTGVFIQSEKETVTENPQTPNQTILFRAQATKEQVAKTPEAKSIIVGFVSHTKDYE
jgi:hypothetical protein